MRRSLFILALLAATTAQAQTGAYVRPGRFNMPNSVTLPATCVVGDMYVDTNATSGARVYLCESTNTWVSQGGGGAGDTTAVGDCASGACFDGTSGTTLTFNNAGGDATQTYDGTNIDFSVPILASSVTVDQTASGGLLELLEATGGSNKLTIQAPTAITADGTCTLLDTTARFIPNACLELVESADIAQNTITADDLAATITFADADLLDLSAVNASSATEGILLPQAASTVASTAEGQIAWDSDHDYLQVGAGSSNNVLVGSGTIWPFYQSGRWIDWRRAFGFYPNVSSSYTPTSARLIGWPMVIHKRTAFDRISMQVTTQGTTSCAMRLGIYRAGSDGLPGALVVDAGTPAADCMTTGAKTITINTTLDAGYYFLALAINHGGGVQFPAASSSESPHLFGTTSGSSSPAADTGYNSVVATFDCGATCSTALPDPFTAGGTITAGTMPVVALRAQ